MHVDSTHQSLVISPARARLRVVWKVLGVCCHLDAGLLTCYFCLLGSTAPALSVMDVRNHGRCHGDATLQDSFFFFFPASRPLTLAAAPKPEKSRREEAE